MWAKIVMNLLSNALKFTFAGGVTVRLRAIDGAARADGHRHRHRHRAGRPGAALRALPSRRRRALAQPRGHRDRARAGRRAGRPARRRRGGARARRARARASRCGCRSASEHLPQDQVASERPRRRAEQFAEGFVAEALRWLTPRTSPWPPSRRRAPARARRRRQRGHARLHRVAAREPLRRRDGRRRRDRARAGPARAAGARRDRRDDAQPRRVRAAGRPAGRSRRRPTCR